MHTDTLTPEQIAHSHAIDDLTRALATARRALVDTVWAMGIARDANANGVTDVVGEYLDRAIAIATGAHTATRDPS